MAPSRPSESPTFGLPSGRLLNEFVVRRLLGLDGFGITCLAHDTMLDEDVALKEYRNRHEASTDADRWWILMDDLALEKR